MTFLDIVEYLLINSVDRLVILLVLLITIFPTFSELRTTKNYAVQLEKYTARQFRHKGREHPESYFHFPQWETAAWDNYKKDIGEGYSPIDKIEGK